MTSLQDTPGGGAVRQLIILERGLPVATEVIVLGKELNEHNASALLDEIEWLEASWKVKFNRTPPRDHAHYHLIGAFEGIGVRFLSDWEQLEIDIREELAAGRYDDPATWRARVRAHWGTDLWLVTMLGGDEGAAKAKAIAAADHEANEWDRWLVDGKIGEEATKNLRSRFAVAKAALEAKPVKSADKLDRQIGAYLDKNFDRAILDRSFKQWFAYCYHPGSPSNFGDKQPHILAHNLFIDPKPPAETLALVRSSLPFFTPARAKSRRVHIWDIEPVREHLLRWKRAAEAAKKV